MTCMQWERLLSPIRLGQSRPVSQQGRTPFNTDHDRITFSSAFRRLQDKTQVFPLAETDYVRTRLTHSLEAGNIGRTLGIRAGESLLAATPVDGVSRDDLGTVVATATLAHDMGNPPFGHSGEDAIREWFRSHPLGQEILGAISAEAARTDPCPSAAFPDAPGAPASAEAPQLGAMAEAPLEQLPAQVLDLLYFEGNAQGFRILNRLQFPDRPCGMRLTCAVLGAFAKYPCDAARMELPTDGGYKKFGLFTADRSLFARAAEQLGLVPLERDGLQPLEITLKNGYSLDTLPDPKNATPQHPGIRAWARHPLAYLVEAADDISYSVADIEDGFRRGRVTYDEVYDLLCPLVPPKCNSWWPDTVREIQDPTERVEFLRALAIGGVVDSAVECFVANEAGLLRGDYLPKGLTRHMSLAEPFATLGAVNMRKVYQDPQVVEIEAAGYDVMDKLLTTFGGAVYRRYLAMASAGGDRHLTPVAQSARDRTLLKLFPRIRHAAPDSLYEHMLEVTDFVSGMTDTSAVSLYKKLAGMTLVRG